MRHAGFALLSLLATFAVAACTTTTTGNGGGSSGGSPDGATTPSTPGADGGAESSTSLPPPSASEANVDVDGTCPAFSACGGSPQGTYDYAAGCISDAVSAVQQQCPTADTSGLKVTVRGSLHFVGDALTRDAVSTTSGTIVLPATCSQGQCAAVESALKSAFDSATCSGSAACTCTVKRVDTTKDATTFTVAGSTLTTAAGDTYAICASGSSLAYQGRSAGAEDGFWKLTKR